MSASNYRLSRGAALAEAKRNGTISVIASRPPTPVEDVEADSPTKPPMVIASAALWEANRGHTAPFDAAAMLAPPKPPPGVLPANVMAMDNVPAVNTWALQSVFHEGLAFVGYQYLAELSQRAEYRRIAEIWAEHAVRKWIKWRGPQTKIDAMAAEFERLEVRAQFQEACEQDALFGRSQIFMDFGDRTNATELNAPLVRNVGKVSPKRPLKRLKVVEPMWSYPGPYETTNPIDPTFYKPQFWYVYGKTISDTRFLTFVGAEVPDMLKPSYAFGGLSKTQQAKPYIDNWLRTRQSVSDMVSAFSHMVLKTNTGDLLSGGTGGTVFARAAMATQIRDNRGMWLLDKESEELESVAVPLSGLAELNSQAQEQVSSVAGIPLSIYLQVTPSGLDSSTTDEIRSFYAAVKALQERLFRRNLETLADYVQLSLFGSIDPTIKFEFPDLWEVTDQERSKIRTDDATAHNLYVAMGAVSNEEVRQALSSDEVGLYIGVDLSAKPTETLDIPDEVDPTPEDDKSEENDPSSS